MGDRVCLYCGIKLSEHRDKTDPLSDHKGCELKCYFKCTQSDDVLCNCNPDTSEMGSFGYAFIE